MAQEVTTDEIEENTSQSESVSKLPVIRPGKGGFVNGVRLDVVLLDGVDISEEASSLVGLGGYVEVVGEGLKVIDSVALRFFGEQHTPQNLQIYDNEISFTIPNYEKVLGDGGKIEVEFLSLLKPTASFKLFNKLTYQTLEERQKAQKQKKQDQEQSYNQTQASDLQAKSGIGDTLSKVASESMEDVLNGVSGGVLVSNSTRLKKALDSKNKGLISKEVERLVEEKDVLTLKESIKNLSDSASLQIVQKAIKKLEIGLESSFKGITQETSRTAGTVTGQVFGNGGGGRGLKSQNISASSQVSKNINSQTNFGGADGQNSFIGIKTTGSGDEIKSQASFADNTETINRTDSEVNVANSSSSKSEINKVANEYVQTQVEKSGKKPPMLNTKAAEGVVNILDSKTALIQKTNKNVTANLSQQNIQNQGAVLADERPESIYVNKDLKLQGQQGDFREKNSRNQNQENVQKNSNLDVREQKKQVQNPEVVESKKDVKKEPLEVTGENKNSQTNVGQKLEIGSDVKSEERISASGQPSEFKSKLGLMRKNEALIQAKSSVKSPGGSLPKINFRKSNPLLTEKKLFTKDTNQPNFAQELSPNMLSGEADSKDENSDLGKRQVQKGTQKGDLNSSQENTEDSLDSADNISQKTPQQTQAPAPVLSSAKSIATSVIKKEISQAATKAVTGFLVRIFGGSILPYVLMAFGVIFGIIFFVTLIVYGGCNFPVGKVAGLGYRLSYMGGAGFENICEMVDSASGGFLSTTSNAGVVPSGVLSTGSWTAVIQSAAARYSPVDACMLRVVVQKESGGRADAIGCDCAYNGNPGACRNQPKTYYSGYDFNWDQCSYGIGISQWTIYQRIYANSTTDFRRWQNSNTPSRTPFGTNFYTVNDLLNPETSLNLTAEKFKRELDRNGGNVRAAFESYVGQSSSTQKFVDERMELYNMCKGQGG